ncbi:MAG TPA: glycoside hydrolase family 172 protein [Tepidisphaeraceae bacterium]|nr:glycoside hydrolase family 172 protein [Tepidisphaeraceae bacterium]
MKLTRILAAVAVLAIVASIPALIAAYQSESGTDAAPSASLGYGSLSNLALLGDAQSRSISPENFTGEKGQAGMATKGTGQNAARSLGQGWKISPSVVIKAHSTFTMGEITGPGCVEHIWMTPTGNWRHSIFRIYWDGEDQPSVECPVGDFFACGLGRYCQNNSIAVCVNPGSAFNCYWPMPFHKSAKLTMENIDDKNMVLYYSVDYSVGKVPQNAGTFHAQFRQEAPLKEKGIYTILDGVKGHGQYVGTYMTWKPNAPRWWGEGEIKFYIDGDDKFPTIAGTGTEDYFCGSYDFVSPYTHRYQVFSTPYSGLVQVIPPDQVDQAGQQYGLYRWHIPDPIRFGQELKVTIQALGWQSDGRYLQEQNTISSVAYWYQSEPHAPYPPLPSRDDLDK